MSKELKYLEGLLDKINAKLSNDKFLKNAKPEIIELERKKRIDTENKIKVLKLR
jgi:valyl-tRNA synthetase